LPEDDEGLVMATWWQYCHGGNIVMVATERRFPKAVSR